VCQNVKIDCSGCSENLPRHAIPIHQNQCPEFVIECINCDSSMKRKVVLTNISTRISCIIASRTACKC
jgi:hypothetical protein